MALEWVGHSGVIYLPEWLSTAIAVADVLTLAIILAIGYKLRSWPVLLLGTAQLLLISWFEWQHGAAEVTAVLYYDNLALVMLLLVNVLGPLIAIYAVPYMAEHERHLHLTASRQPRLFAIMVLFLLAMNGLVLADNLLWVYFFWEITTLCSFLLIAHDQTETAVSNATTALIINSFGGLAFCVGIVGTHIQAGTLSLSKLIISGEPGLVLLPLVFFIVAAMTKSAQLPFSKWLLGAMVAPTPVSALLHSSTMVKAGVYLVLRLAPIYLGTWLAKIVTVMGALTFAVAALAAISQTNAKRILAYSTISNLGLIIALAGISHIYAVYGAILLLVLHGVSKALLFMCVGTVEQTLRSRDVEAMDGLRTLMPLTAKLALVGSLSMLVPPFGILITKWIGIEVSTENPVAMLLIILGSAFTVVFWSKFIGKMLSSDPTKAAKEHFGLLLHGPLAVIGVLVLAISGLMVPFSEKVIGPYIQNAYAQYRVGWLLVEWNSSVRDFLSWDLAVAVGVILFFGLLAWLFYNWFQPRRYVQAYLAGENGPVPNTFVTAGDAVCAMSFKNYYLRDLISEHRITYIADVVAWLLIIAMFGVML